MIIHGEEKKVVAILQARMSSTRLPNKVMADLCGVPMIVQVVNRVRQAKRLDQVVLATSTEDSDTPLAELCEQYGIPCFRGDLNDVLDRFYQCAKAFDADYVIRLTGDDPFIDHRDIDDAIAFMEAHPDLDWTTCRPGLPLGNAFCFFRFSALEKAWKEADDPSCREHVTIYIYLNPDKFNLLPMPPTEVDNHHYRFTVDTPEDYELAKKIYGELYHKDSAFSVYDAIEVCKAHPEWMEINADVQQKKHGYDPNK